MSISKQPGLAIDILTSFLASEGIELCHRSTSKKLWNEAYSLLQNQCTGASYSVIDYHLEYERGNNYECTDLSSLLKVNGVATALWPLSISTLNGYPSLARPGGRTSCPYFVRGLTNELQEIIAKVCYQACLKLSAYVGQKEFKSNCFDPASTRISPWQIYAMQRGASCVPKHEALVDLGLPIEKIKRSFRKSYKSLINKSERIWHSEVVHSSEISTVWESFKALHLEAAGKKTRSDESWVLQKNSIENGEAFLVAVYMPVSLEKQLIGAGFFTASMHEGFYAVGAYKRELFDQPVSHVVQLRAIEEFKRRGCKHYHIGSCRFPGEKPTPSDKEISLSFFKSGFANYYTCSYDLTHRLINHETAQN